MSLRAPVPLAEQHRLASFDCGHPPLNDWLRRRALPNQQSGATRAFVASEGESGTVVAYYALASGAVAITEATGRLRRNMPDPIPVVLLARLAVDRRHQRQGVARALLRDAGLRVLHAADSIGIRGLLTHALDDAARAFYLRLGFDASPLAPMTLMITLADLRAALGSPGARARRGVADRQALRKGAGSQAAGSDIAAQ
jgi:GNAT superfamily N-acetyltransferase